MSVPQYRWTLADFRSDADSVVGIELSAEAARGALLLAIGRAGGLRQGMTANVHRPSGGGWRAHSVPGCTIAWEEFGA